MSTAVCQDTRVDWMTTSGHYDARGARTCQVGSLRVGAIYDPAGWSARDVTGLQKAAGCVYNQGPVTYSGCQYVSASASGCPFPTTARVWTAKVHSILLRAQSG